MLLQGGGSNGSRGAEPPNPLTLTTINRLAELTIHHKGERITYQMKNLRSLFSSKNRCRHTDWQCNVYLTCNRFIICNID